ncbi:amine dehydrogenase [Dechloromonas denitrificans]|uniref:amine dehydrogenase large subunit n=1 Tax=Dechloromonas denitrificans TaxID=281362 RepID=UPI001CF8A865|nr:amine dehydrogenase large subunit [Dechloromonas denitrificans]UCV11390.1 amine dehydrogenase [Dechloromonas denitrificans]
MIPKRAVLLSLLAALGAALPAHAELPVDEITVGKLAPAHPYRLYYTDVALPHLADGKLTVIDGRTLKVEGMVSTGMFAQTTLSPDRSELYAVTTYYSKLNRGERIEEILVYDAKTLALKEEIPYSARHAQALPYRGTLRTSADGRFIIVQNATPATSVSIVNRQTGKQVSEIQTPGCYIVYPAQTANRFSTLCGDGTMLTISLDNDGNPVGKKKSVKFFDPDEDALFVSAAQEGDNYHFVSYKGNAVTVNVGGEAAVPGTFWKLGNDADVKKGWRPGGYQPVALHQASGTLYVGMHPKGFEGSHKEGAREIWVYDLASKTRVSRTKTTPATGLAVSQGDAPRVFAFDSAKAGVAAFDGGRKLKPVGAAVGFGDTPTQLEVQ